MLSSMENFKILEQLGKGVQFTILKVESKIDGKTYVIKKVECHDESQANLAFREAVALQALDHPYISGYKEFFVTWEKEDSSMYMIIVMDYFPKGHLGNVVQRARENKEAIPEETVKKYIGQLMEALVYVHSKNILHRDLRVTNVFLVEEPLLQEDILILADFAVASVMCDTRTCTRRTSKLTNYLAPELTEKGADFSESTDVWSLGCILFELTTASFLSEAEAVTRLGEVREDPYKLEEIFEDVAKTFSGDLINLIRVLLKRNNRPTAKDLMEKNVYVKSCIEKSDASQLEKRKRQKSGKRVKGPVPKEGNILKVLEYIATMVDFEDCVAEALEYIVELSKQDENFQMDVNGKRMIKAAMRNNLPVKEIQIAGCNLFNSLVISADKDDVLFTSEIISVIPLAMEEHEDCVELQQVACTLLMAIAAQDNAASIAGLYGAIERVLSALDKHITNPELCSTACHALWSLAVNENNVKIASDDDAMTKVCKALRLHMNSAEVAEAASAALLSLTLNDKNFDFIGDLECVALLINAIDTHCKNAKVVKNACLALASLVEPDEESAYRVLTDEAPDGGHIAGIPKIIKAYELHKDNAEVVASIVTLVMELAEYDEICIDLQSFKVKSIMREVQQKFVKNEDIMGPCEKALSKLQQSSSSQKISA